MIAGLQEGLTYVYQVRAKGDGLSNSDPSDPSSATVLPATPANFTATAVSNSQIDLSWTNASTVATAFRLQERVGRHLHGHPPPQPDQHHVLPSNLIAGTTHEYRVFAIVDGFEDSAPQIVNSFPTGVQSATTTAVSTVAFTAPPGTFTTDEASAQGEGICLLQRFSPTLLVPNVTGTQVRLTLRGANSGSLTLDRITISRPDPAAGADPYRLWAGSHRPRTGRRDGRRSGRHGDCRTGALRFRFQPGPARRRRHRHHVQPGQPALRRAEWHRHIRQDRDGRSGRAGPAGQITLPPRTTSSSSRRSRSCSMANKLTGPYRRRGADQPAATQRPGRVPASERRQ